MIDVLMFLSLLILMSGFFRGRYADFVFEGTPMDRKYKRVGVVGSVLAVPVASAMPFADPGSNYPALALAGAYCVVVALVLYPLTNQDKVLQVANPRGRYAKPLSEQAPILQHTPYRVVMWLGYWLVGGYIYLNS
ncbi:hypothetical protein D6T65_10065 [Arthrobacter frigidicola]|nr:hypothetical protein D6T65_10065 [Arthrobacter frigidicola]